MSTEIIINQDIVEINVTEEIVVVEAPAGAYPLPSTVSSVFGRTGSIIATIGDYNTSLVTENTNLYFTNARARTAISLTTTGTSGAATYDNATGIFNIPQYQGGVTSFNTRTGAITLLSADVTGALGYTPVTNARTLTINGTTYDLTADRSWTIATGSGTVTSVGLSAPTGFSVTNSPITTSGTLALGFASGYSLPTNVKQSNWDDAYNRSLLSAAVTGTTTKTLTLNQQDGGTITASWTDINTDAVTSVFGRTGAVVATEGDYTLTQLGDVTITTPANGQVLKYNGTTWVNGTDTDTGLTSVGLSMPSAFTVTNSPLTANGTLSVTGAGTTAQYVRGDGSLATFPSVAQEAQRLITEVYNNSGATLTKGTVVYINGGQGNLPTVTKALATGDATSAQTYGIVQTDITNMNNGFVVVIGSLSDLDTQAYAVGTQLYLSSTVAGAWTSVKQYAPAHLVYVGIVVRSHPTQGVVEVRIQNGFELDELHDVSAQSPTNGDILQYVASTDLWTKTAGTTTNIAEGTNLYYTDARSRSALSFVAGSGAYNSTTGVITIPTNNNQITNGSNYITLASLSGNTGISYNNTTGVITNSAPDQTVSLTSGAGISVSGTYPSFTIASTITQYTDALARAAISGGTGISYNSTSGVITNTITQYTDALARASISLTTTGSSGAATYDNTTGVLNIPQYSGGGGGGMAIGGSITSATAGSVLFAGASGVLAQDNANFFWDNTNKRLGIGTATPTTQFEVQKNQNQQTSLRLRNTTSGNIASVEFGFYTNSGNGGIGKYSTTTNPYKNISSGSTYIYNGDSGDIAILNDLATGGFSVSVAGSNNAQFILNSSGNIGLSTATIGSRLQINGNAAIGYSASTAAPTNGLAVSGNISANSNIIFPGSTYSWGAFNIRYVQFQNYASVLNGDDGTKSYTSFGLNYYEASALSFRYMVGDLASRYQQRAGVHSWYVAGSGSAGATISFTQAMTLDASANLGIGTTTIGSRLQVNGNAAIGYSASTAAPTNGLAVSGAATFGSSVTALSLVKSGGTSAQILAADGSVITAGTNITISGGTISSTGGGGASITLSAIGSTPNANAATLTGSALNLEPASASFGGVVTTGTQTFAGAKTFNSTITASSIIKSGGTNTQYLMADGSVTTGSGGTVSMTIGGSITGSTVGSILFVGTSGVLEQNNANLFWDNTNNNLSVAGSASVTGVLSQTIITNRQTASYTLVLTDRSKLVEMNVATANNLTIPLNSSVAFPIGTQIDLSQYGAGQTTVVATGGVTIRSTNSWVKLNARYGAATLIKIGTDEWYLFGNLNA